jgi:hypothetical protein
MASRVPAGIAGSVRCEVAVGTRRGQSYDLRFEAGSTRPMVTMMSDFGSQERYKRARQNNLDKIYAR